MNKENNKAGFAFDRVRLVVIVLVCLTAVIVLAGQMSYGNDPQSQISLANLNKRATYLQTISDPVQRDQMCVGLSAMGRELDRELPKDTRVFITDMLGPTNVGSLGYYYFMRNYLFPRQVDISLDGKGTFLIDGCHGIPCDSPDVLRSNGYDLMASFKDNQPRFVPLTAKVEPKSQ